MFQDEHIKNYLLKDIGKSVDDCGSVASPLVSCIATLFNWVVHCTDVEVVDTHQISNDFHTRNFLRDLVLF